MGAKATMVVWNVDHGLAIYLNTPADSNEPNGRHIVIDLGAGSHGNDKTFSPLKYMNRKYGLKHIDYLVVTHPHADHLDDIMAIEELGLGPTAFRRPRNLSKSALLKGMKEPQKERLERFFEMDERFTAQMEPGNVLSTPANWGGLSIDTWTASPETDTDNVNNHSLVVVIDFARTRIVIAGDNEPPSWDALRKVKGFIDAVKNADILIAPHHGRESGWHADMVKDINPALTIISDKMTDTTIDDKYRALSRGWKVRKGDNVLDRWVLTTRSDGVVSCIFGWNGDGTDPFLEVNI